MRDSLGNLLFQSATTAALYNPSMIGEENLVVTPPCRAVVAGAGGGFVAIIDSFASGELSDTVLYTRPFVGNGIMLEGQILPQVLGRPPCSAKRPSLRAARATTGASCWLERVWSAAVYPAMRLMPTGLADPAVCCRTCACTRRMERSLSMCRPTATQSCEPRRGAADRAA